MPTRNVNLTPHFDQFIDAGISSGRFSNASELVREGLRLLEQRRPKTRPNSTGSGLRQKRPSRRSIVEKASSCVLPMTSAHSSTMCSTRFASPLAPPMPEPRAAQYLRSFRRDVAEL